MTDLNLDIQLEYHIIINGHANLQWLNKSLKLRA